MKETQRHSIYSDANTVTREEFKNPSVKYRSAPFWAWNCKLEPERLVEQIPYFKEMGFGGFHMHVRAGMDLTYMSSAFLDRIAQCVEQAEILDLIPRLYDEDCWPSGFVGGLAVKGHPELRRRTLHFTKKASDNAYATVGRYDISLHEDGTLKSYRLLQDGETAENTEWLAQIVVDGDTKRYANSAYIDTLNPEAVQRFISMTHVEYKKKLRDKFGTTVPSIFTDEPRAPKWEPLPAAKDSDTAILPWTDLLPISFYKAYGVDIVAALPELVWDLPQGRYSRVRWQFYDHVAELFARAYFDTIGAWCEENGIDFCGHLMAEHPLKDSVASSGEAMRCYRGMQMPGMDMLCGLYEYTTAKQVQSVVRQMDKNGMVSELYGVIGWDGDFRDHKLQGDWQAALGVTLRVPHLAWCSMQGERKRDFPQSIFYQSPWFREYPLIENHFARVNMAMTQGKPVCHVGVIHPIESFWLHCGPDDTSAEAQKRITRNWENITEWLLFGGHDFDFISESMLPNLCEKGAAPLCVGKGRYDVVIVPECETLRSSTLERLRAFRDASGTLIFMGKAPTCMDAVPNAAPKALAEDTKTIPFEKDALLAALADFREVSLQKADGGAVSDLLYQLRQDDSGRWLFLAHGKKSETADESVPESIVVTICGNWKAELYNTLTGETAPLAAEYHAGKTALQLKLYAQDSALLRLMSGMAETAPVKDTELPAEISIAIPAETAYTLSEPNVFLLDKAEYRLDDEPWQPEEEILRLDKRCRYKLNWHGGIQPWLIPDEAPTHTLALRFSIDSEVEQGNIRLALENLQKTTIRWNGEPVASQSEGWYVDRDIQTVRLPALKKGKNTLELMMPFEFKISTEWYYLLGDFGVSVQGGSKCVTAKKDAIEFNNIVPQGLPFYSGEVTYDIPFTAPKDGVMRIRVPAYHAALLKCAVDNENVGAIAFAPYEVKAPIAAGAHTLHLTAFINRTNVFGPLHNATPDLKWFGQDAWKSTGDAWTYDYILQEEGITAAPVLTLQEGEIL